MVRRVVSVLRRPVGGFRAGEPALEANAFAIAEDVELTLLLLDDGVELAVAAAETAPADVAGVALPPAAAAQDLRGLVESGVGVCAAQEALAARGIGHGALVTGVEVVDDRRIAGLLGEADAVLTW